MIAALVLGNPKLRGWRALLLRLLPWYDVAAERERDARSAAIHRRAIRARIEAEQVRKAYLAVAERMRRS